MMIPQTFFLLLCAGILLAVNGCYLSPYPYGYTHSQPYVYAYPQPYVQAYPRHHGHRHAPYHGHRRSYRSYAPY